MNTRARPRLRRLAAEALDNIASGRILSLVVLTTAFAAIGGATLAETHAADTALDREAAFRRSGGYVYDIRAFNPDGTPTAIDRARCERLALSDSIAAAGSVGAAIDAAVTVTPDESVGLITASPGMTGVLQAMNPQQYFPAEALIVARQRFEQLQLTDRSSIAVGDLDPAFPIAADLDTLAPGYNRAALTIGPTRGPATTCYIAVHPGTIDSPAALLAPLADPRARIVPLIDTGDAFQRPVELYRSRPERSLWWLIAVAMMAVSAITLWLRRGEIALYHAIGLTANDVRIVTAVEHLTLITTGGATGIVAAAAISRLQDQRTPAIDHGLWVGLTALAASLVVSALSAVFARHGNALEHLKDR